MKQEGEVERVYRLLKGWILECRFLPGDFLPEVETAKQCNTSRTPIREACSRLAEEKWLSRIRHRGYMVAQISIREVVELYEYRKLLECFAAEKAAQNASPEFLVELKNIIAVESKRKPASSEILAANDRFHLGIGQAARNQRVFDQLKLTLEYVHRLDILSTRRDGGWIAHGEILAALEARKPRMANRAMAAHIDSSRDRMLKLFGT